MSKPTPPLDYYRDHWYEIGSVLAMGITGGAVLRQSSPPTPQHYAALNLAALMVHQFEEYKFPGTFPGQYNGNWFKSTRPDHYPLNTNSALVINTAIAYTVYLLPVLLPKTRWLGIAPTLFGFLQCVGHGFVFPRLMKQRYSAGFLASALLHVPIGIRYLRAVQAERPITRQEWVGSVLYTAAFMVAGVLAPQQLLKDKDSPYRFNADQVRTAHTGEALQVDVEE